MNENKNIEVIKIGLADLQQLKSLSITTFSEAFMKFNKEEDMLDYLNVAFTDIQLSKELSNLNSTFYFAYRERELAGYIKVNLGPAQTDIQDSNSLEIERIYVLEKHQGKKVGFHLFDKALAIAKENKVDIIWLGVWEENQQAIDFYEKLGFTRFGKHSFLLGTDEQTDILMKRNI